YSLLVRHASRATPAGEVVAGGTEVLLLCRTGKVDSLACAGIGDRRCDLFCPTGRTVVLDRPSYLGVFLRLCLLVTAQAGVVARLYRPQLLDAGFPRRPVQSVVCKRACTGR